MRLVIVTIICCSILMACTKTRPQEEKNVSLSSIVVNEAPTSEKTNPLDVSVKQIHWMLSNGKKIPASHEAVLLNTSLGDDSIVGLKVPGTTQPWYNIALLKNKNGEWMINELIDFPISTRENSDKKKILLPIDSFDEITTTGKNSRTWSFANDNQLIVISKSHQKISKKPAGFISVKEMNKNIYVKSTSQQSILYYNDGKYLIQICGNISQKQLIELGKSLPSATSVAFPFYSKFSGKQTQFRLK